MSAQSLFIARVGAKEEMISLFLGPVQSPKLQAASKQSCNPRIEDTTLKSSVSEQVVLILLFRKMSKILTAREGGSSRTAVYSTTKFFEIDTQQTYASRKNFYCSQQSVGDTYVRTQVTMLRIHTYGRFLVLARKTSKTLNTWTTLVNTYVCT